MYGLPIRQVNLTTSKCRATAPL